MPERPEPGSHERFRESINRPVTLTEAERLYDFEREYQRQSREYYSKMDFDFNEETGLLERKSRDPSLKAPTEPAFMPIVSLMELERLFWQLDDTDEEIEVLAKKIGGWASILYTLGRGVDDEIRTKTEREQLARKSNLGELHSLLVKAFNILWNVIDKNYPGWQKQVSTMEDIKTVVKDDPEKSTSDLDLARIALESLCPFAQKKKGCPAPLELAYVFTQINKMLGILNLPRITAARDKFPEN